MTGPTLFRSLLGSSLDLVSGCVRDLHFEGDLVRVAGDVDVQPARNPLGRFLCVLGGIPRIRGRAPVELVIEGTPASESWCRTIGSWRFRSHHTAENGALVERVGALELRFVLSVEDRGIRYTQTAAYLRLMGMRIRLPRMAAPRVEAFEHPDADGRSVMIGVMVSTPLAGLLVRYDGRVQRVPA